MNPLVFHALQAARALRFRRFLKDCDAVQACQERMLQSLVARQGSTRLGRRLGADQVRTLKDLVQKVPLTTYDDIQPEVEASLRGEPDVMVPGRPEFFAMTAGTTGARKALPITPQYRKEFQRPVHLFLYGIGRDHPDATAHKALYFVGGTDIDRSPSGVPMGALSGYNFKNVPAVVRRLYASPFEAFALSDSTSRSYAIALTALAHRVSCAVAITTQPLAQMGQVMVAHTESLLRDLHDGTLHSPGEISSSERKALLAFIKAHPKRAKELEARASKGRFTPAAAWPELRLLSCWYHAGAGAHAHELPDLYGPVPIRAAIYSATEGWFTIPLEDHNPSGVLSVDSAVYEFIPVDGRGQPQGEPRFAHELRQGEHYHLVVTSGAGIWRYQLRDEVQCTGFLRQAPCIQFVQKAGNAMSLAHDLTTEAHVEKAILTLQNRGIALGRYCFGPGDGVPPRYVLAVEHEGAWDGAQVSEAFDKALRQANFGYEADREDGALNQALVVPVSARAFAEWDERRASESSGAQSKPARFVKRKEDLAGLVQSEASHGS